MEPDHIEVCDDGKRRLRRGHSPFKAKAKAHLEECREVLAERHKAKMAKVAVKRAKQRNSGWPADKSPI